MLYYYIALMSHVAAYVQNPTIRRNQNTKEKLSCKIQKQLFMSVYVAEIDLYVSRKIWLAESIKRFDRVQIPHQVIKRWG